MGLHVLGYVSLPLPGLEHLISQFVAYSHYLPHCPSSKWHIYIYVCVCVYTYINVYMQGVPGGLCQISGECYLC